MRVTGSRSSSRARPRLRNLRFTVVVLILVALFALVAGDRIAGVASARKPDKALKQVRAPRDAKPESVPVAAPVEAPKLRGGHHHDDHHHGGHDEDDDGVSIPKRSQSTESPSTAAVPVQSTPAPTTPVSYTHLRAHETDSYLVCRLLL